MTSVDDLKQQLAETIRRYHQWGWSPATSTNYSFRHADYEDVIYISRSGIDKANFSAEDFMSVNLSGQPVAAYKNIRPSAETLIHCALYQMFPQTHCILHSHSVHAALHSAVNDQSISFSGHEILKGFEGIKTHESQVEMPIFDNSQDMQSFSQMLIDQQARLTLPAFIIKKHGTYAWGKSLLEAKRHLESSEFLFEVEWQLRKH